MLSSQTGISRNDFSTQQAELRLRGVGQIPSGSGQLDQLVSHHTTVTHHTQPPIPTLTLSATATCDGSVNSRDPLGIAAIIRAQTARDFLATLAEWQRASGPDRAYWRRYVRLHIAEERARLARNRAALHAAATRTARKDAA